MVIDAKPRGVARHAVDHQRMAQRVRGGVGVAVHARGVRPTHGAIRPDLDGLLPDVAFAERKPDGA